MPAKRRIASAVLVLSLGPGNPLCAQQAAGGSPASAPAVLGEEPLRTTVRSAGTDMAHLLAQSPRRAKLPGKTCKAKLCAGATIGAGVGAFTGALLADKARAGAAYGAILFAPLGAALAFNACGR
jgi:hypothetical protein